MGPKCIVNNTNYLFIEAFISGWDLLGSKWTCSSQSCRDISRKNGQGQGFKGVEGKLWWLEARASPKLFLWGIPSLQWSVSIKHGPRKEWWWTRPCSWKDIPMPFFNGITVSCTKQKRFRNGLRGTASFRCSPSWNFSRFQSSGTSVGCAGQTSLILGGHTSQLITLKGSFTNTLVPDTTAHHQRSGGVHVSSGQGCFGSKKGANTILGKWKPFAWLV